MSPLHSGFVIVLVGLNLNSSSGSDTITSIFWVGVEEPVSAANATPSTPPDVQSPASLILILYVFALKPVNWTEDPEADDQEPPLTWYLYGAVPPLITKVNPPELSPLQLRVLLPTPDGIVYWVPERLLISSILTKACNSSDGPVTVNNSEIEHDAVDAETFPVETWAFASETITI